MLRDARSALLSMRQRSSQGEPVFSAIGGFVWLNPPDDLRANASKQKRRVKARRFFPASKARLIHCGIQFARSVHADPLRPVHADRVSGASGQIDCNPMRKRTAVVDHDGYGSSVVGIGHRHLRSEGQCAMRGRIPAAVEGLTARGPTPRGIESCNHMLSCAGAVRPGVREEPCEAAAVGWGG